MMKYLVASSGWPAPNSSPAKAGVSMLAAEPRGAVQHQHRLAGRFADRRVGEAQLGHHLAGVELEVARDPLALLRRRIVGRHGRERQHDEHQYGEKSCCSHDVLPASLGAPLWRCTYRLVYRSRARGEGPAGRVHVGNLVGRQIVGQQGTPRRAIPCRTKTGQTTRACSRRSC